MATNKRKCKNCDQVFEKQRPLQFVCSPTCATQYGTKQRLKQVNKEWREEKKVLREKLKTHKDYLNELQVVFNTFIRLRDIEKGCISCGRSLVGVKFDAGHFYSVGGNPALRFNENNTHGQCVHCNRDKHGNLLEYAERLPARIGDEGICYLKLLKEHSSKLSIPELIAKTAHYKAQIKILQERNE